MRGGTGLPGAVFGFHCSHEQHSPSALLRHLAHAQDAGFAAAMCSDHFHPWSHRQGHSGFTWSWLGSALQATALPLGTVCAPGQRYHPAVIAQAAATLAEMFPDRFWLAVGSGERLNEGITGAAWPSKADRNRRLEESVHAMRRLWAGEVVTTRGLVTIEHAQLFVRPAQPPKVFGAAITPETAQWVAGWADGLITVAGPRDTMRQVVEAFRAGGGEGKPMFLQVALSFAPTEDEALAAAMDQWRQCALPPELLADLATPDDFDRAVAGVGAEQLQQRLRVSSEARRHAAWLESDRALGFERIFLHNVARNHQEWFIDVFGDEVLPEFS
jgi:coenzyme F420-dependent glucose-6-phosphate dehydrogenase